jgi:hypothetical protein
MAPLSGRLLAGALAGIAGTAAMTMFMQRTHARLPTAERYPLPPREITAIVARQMGHEESAHTADLALAAHFAFGAGAGALAAALRMPARPWLGALCGVGVWAASYLGWVPLSGILRPPSRHPARRNGLMAAAHLVWGGVTAAVLSELYRARRGMLAEGPARDA